MQSMAARRHNTPLNCWIFNTVTNLNIPKIVTLIAITIHSMVLVSYQPLTNQFGCGSQKALQTHHFNCQPLILPIHVSISLNFPHKRTKNEWHSNFTRLQSIQLHTMSDTTNWSYVIGGGSCIGISFMFSRRSTEMNGVVKTHYSCSSIKMSSRREFDECESHTLYSMLLPMRDSIRRWGARNAIKVAVYIKLLDLKLSICMTHTHEMWLLGEEKRPDWKQCVCKRRSQMSLQPTLKWIWLPVPKSFHDFSLNFRSKGQIEWWKTSKNNKKCVVVYTHWPYVISGC